ncbi:MAG: hypothetical protein GX334_06455 [Firmicutes bacterium]|nr:hypothetical protein [Bacillota bacterium]
MTKKTSAEQWEAMLKRHEAWLQKEKQRLIKECGLSEEEAEIIIESHR